MADKETLDQETDSMSFDDPAPSHAEALPREVTLSLEDLMGGGRTERPESPASVVFSELVKIASPEIGSDEDIFSISDAVSQAVASASFEDLQALFSGVEAGIRPRFVVDTIRAGARSSDLEVALLEAAWKAWEAKKGERENQKAAPEAASVEGILEQVGRRAAEALDREARRECGSDRTTMHLLLYNLSAEVDADPAVIECVQMLANKKKDPTSVMGLVFELEQELNGARRAAAERLVSNFVSPLREEQLAAIFSNTVDNASIWDNFQINLKKDVVKEVLWRAAHTRYQSLLSEGGVFFDNLKTSRRRYSMPQLKGSRHQT